MAESLQKLVENAVGKGETAYNDHFLQVFSKDLYCRHVKTRTFWERDNP